MAIPTKHLDQLKRDTAAVEKGRRALDSALFDQANSILLVYSSGEISMRDIAAIANVSHQRIAQVIGSFDNQDMKDRLADEIINRGSLRPGE